MTIQYYLLLGIFSFFLSKANAQESEETKIINLLKTEATTWRTGDLEAHANCWAERPYSKVMVSTNDGRVLDVPVSVIINPPEGMAGNGGRAELSNFSIQINGDTAWVGHDELSIGPDGSRTKSYEFRFLEKVDGQWKLIGQSIHVYPSEK